MALRFLLERSGRTAAGRPEASKAARRDRVARVARRRTILAADGTATPAAKDASTGGESRSRPVGNQIGKGQTDVARKHPNKQKKSAPPAPRRAAPPPAPPAPAPPAPVLEAPRPAERPPAPRPVERKPVLTACYVDFENLFYNILKLNRAFNAASAARSLTRLSREVCGEGFAHTAVYANWDTLTTSARFAQNDWAQVGWRTVEVPTREDQISGRTVKNLVDFVMSLDILEDARDRGYDHFFVVSGDADFCEVVERLKRLRRRVTVVSLRNALSYRLNQAADQSVLWEPEEISGKDSFPLTPPRRAPRVSPGLQRQPDRTELDMLRDAVRRAEEETGAGPIAWEVIRDEYYMPMARCDADEADALVRDLAAAGFVLLEPRRQANGSKRVYLRLP